MASRTETHRSLSAAIITKNEEKRLADCLESLGFVDEILVVDSESTDGTVQVAEHYGARVLVEPWRGFSGQKQFAVDHCTHDWVLVLDADEKVPEETAKVILQEMKTCQAGGVSAFGFRRKNYLHGRWIKYCGWWPDRVLRLVHRKQGQFDGRSVHERWVTRGRVRELEAHIEHRSFADYSQLVMKMESYSSLASRELFQKGKKCGDVETVFHGVWMFVRTYLLELGILDGFDGLLISLTNAGGSFLKYAKLRERWKLEEDRHGRSP